MKPSRLLHLALACLACAHCAVSFAGKSMSCTPSSVATLSPTPGRIIVPAATAVGGALWGGSLSVSFSCSSNATGAKISGGAIVGGSTPAALVSSTGGADGVSVVSTGTPALTVTTPGCSLNSLSEQAGQWTFTLVSSASGSCSATLVAPIEIVRGSGAVGSDVAASQPVGAGGNPQDWIVFPTSSPHATVGLGLSAPVPLVSGGGCTVSPVALTVTLPAVSVASLSVPGSSAGDTVFQFPLQSCLAVPSTAYSVYASWSFSAVAGYPSVIANSAPGGAGQVGVQILDASGVPVTSGPSANSLAGTVDVSGAVAASIYVARYYATGAVTPGAVTATATYTLTYQ